MSGWAFLGRGAGFDVIFSLISYSSQASYGRALLVGLLNTLLVSGLGIGLATALGLVLAVSRLSGNWLASRLALVVVELTRNVPLLLQLFIWYKLVLKPLPGIGDAIMLGEAVALSNKGLTLPHPVLGPGGGAAVAGLLAGLALAGGLLWRRGLTARTGLAAAALPLLLPWVALLLAGWPVSLDMPVRGTFNFSGGMTLVPEFLALLLGLSVYTAGFIAETIRAGIMAVPRGQSEAARALGLSPGLGMRLVILPQALRGIIPPLTNQYLNLTKNSSLGVAIGYPELVAVGGTTLSQTGQAIEVVMVWMVVYLGLSLVTSAFMNWFNARARLVER